MSVRRLAEDTVQPEGFKFNRALGAEAKGWIKKYPKGREQSAVIPLLMLAQEQEGWVTKASIEQIAEMLDMPLIRVMEVATFYTQFMLQPVGTKAHIQVCGTTPCMLRGSEDLMAVCKSKISPNQFELNAEGTLSWEEVECQGACVNAPMVMIFKDTYEDLTPERLEEIIDAFEAGKGDSVKSGPQIDRIYSAPTGGLTTLNGKSVGKSTAPKRNSTAKLAAAAKSVKPKAAAKKPVTEGNSTMKLAATASGTASKKTVSKTTKNAPTKAAKPKAATEMSTGMVKKPTDNRRKTDSVAAKRASPAPARANKAPVKSDGPERLKKPQGKADDLKMIAGVGPKLEKMLNGLGFWHFSQIAKWKKADIAVVDGELDGFKGRIEREDWVKQAKALAKGGRDEYVRVFGKEPR